MKKTNMVTKFATFNGHEGELIEDSYHRFCNMINKLIKNGLKKSKKEINIQYEDEYDIPFDAGVNESGTKDDMSDMKKSLALITRSMNKQEIYSKVHVFQQSLCEARDRYEPRDRNRRYWRPPEPRKYDYGGRANYQRQHEKDKPEKKGKEVKKDDIGPTC
ncbi:hypothetical protein OSB04_024821 [Centaurea solstitialis]|uniref:Uncharacterized protein n=1 Tax=Centaurea solstitialis TaxID=347529 RepID=A0AA38SLW9_9ASTR|nr:hypothetical protein OSB04_024821 [Centaurea solstitialis]